MNDEDARCRQWLPLVQRVAKRFAGCHSVSIEDAFSDGLVGLLRAIRSHDPEKGACLKTWIGKLANMAMIDGLRQRDHVSRKVRAGGLAPALLSLDAPWPTDLQPLFLQSLADRNRPVHAIETREEIESLLRPLGERNAWIIRRYYLDGQTFAAIGREIGLSESAVWLVVKKSLAFLQETHA